MFAAPSFAAASCCVPVRRPRRERVAGSEIGGLTDGHDAEADLSCSIARRGTLVRQLRGYGPDIQKYAWNKVYNSHAFAACSSMPRFGHRGILTEEQIKDVVALLMDPNSPVNK